jgi:ABC-type enterochelin transport system permease subunit
MEKRTILAIILIIALFCTTYVIGEISNTVQSIMSANITATTIYTTINPLLSWITSGFAVALGGLILTLLIDHIRNRD